MFSWPLDGYYTCINCGTVYDTPQSSCTECDHHFVTKLSLCNECGEESLESWFCRTVSVSPSYSYSEEGRFEYFQRRECQCETIDGETPEMVRVYWRPYYECADCDERQKIDHQHDCPDCSAAMVLDNSMEKHVCTRPNCDGETQCRGGPGTRMSFLSLFGVRAAGRRGRSVLHRGVERSPRIGGTGMYHRRM